METKDKTTQEMEERRRCGLLVSRILNEIGKPPAYARTSVHDVGDNRYRVNVHVRDDYELREVGAVMHQLRISDSFYIHLNETDEIVYCSPKPARKYAMDKVKRKSMLSK